jgi:hypothetical protein
MSRYLYTGPNSSVTLKVSDGKGGRSDQDVIFWNGNEVDLPADHEIVVALTAQGFLKSVTAPVQQSAPAAPESKAATAKPGKTK